MSCLRSNRALQFKGGQEGPKGNNSTEKGDKRVPRGTTPQWTADTAWRDFVQTTNLKGLLDKETEATHSSDGCHDPRVLRAW